MYTAALRRKLYWSPVLLFEWRKTFDGIGPD
jgi:hypothetical protein